MSDHPVRRYGLPLLLLILLSLTVVRYWPRKGASASFPGRSAAGAARKAGGPQEFAPPDPVARERMEQALQKLTPEQRQAFEQRMQADRAFFDALRDLPEDERRAKMEEHFAKNPPPAGFDPGSMPPPPDGAPPGGPGDGPPGFGGPMHLPPPSVRRSMDQQIANSQRNANP